MLLESVQYVAGGLMISSAVALNQKFGKRVAEPSTSLYSMLTLDSQSKWRSSFVAGMLFMACLCYSMFGFEEIGTIGIKPFENDKLFFKGTGLVQFMISGLLIGIGTRLAQGGLAKYAFYGVPKFNYQSLVATGTVLMFGIMTATLRATLPILQGMNVTKVFNEHLDFRLSFIIPLAILGINLAKNINNPEIVKDILRSFGIGGLLSAGMMSAGFTRRHLVLDFLNMNNSHWNPFLLLVGLGAFLGSVILLNVFKTQEPIEDAPSSLITPRMLLGCSLFGIGMGMTGLTPGSGLLVSPIYLPQIAMFFLPFVVLGQFAGGAIGKFVGDTPKAVKTM